MSGWMRVRRDGRIVSVAGIVAVGVNNDGRREVLGMAIGPSEAETFWMEFLRTLARRGLRGVKLVISDAHEGLKAAIARVLNASWLTSRARQRVCWRALPQQSEVPYVGLMADRRRCRPTP